VAEAGRLSTLAARAVLRAGGGSTEGIWTRRHLDRDRRTRTVKRMERDTREIFDELTRGMAEELTARRVRERDARRRSLPRLVVTAGIGVAAVSVVGLREPALGAVLFLLVVWVLHRAAGKVAPGSDPMR
jgi:hypothetical protein